MDRTALTLLVLKTRQPERLRDFYAALGIVFSEERHGDGPPHHAGHAGDAVFEIYPLPDEHTAADATTRLGFSVDHLADALHRLHAAGAAPANPPRQTPWSLRAVVRDPDGRAVELYQRQ